LSDYVMKWRYINTDSNSWLIPSCRRRSRLKWLTQYKTYGNPLPLGRSAGVNKWRQPCYA
jgi:hypothetical protein